MLNLLRYRLLLRIYVTMQHSMPRKTIVGGVVVVVAAIAVVAVLLDDDSSDRPSVDPHLTEQQNYHQAQYDAAIVNSWAPGETDRRVGAYLESSWHYPVDQAAAFTVNSRTADETGSSMAAADLARIQTHKLPDYHERGLKEIMLRGLPAVRWSYDLAGTVYAEYFFEECGIDFVIRGMAPSGTWSELASFFDEMAAGVTAKCNE
jgi:hypothetical protein